jgi:hypothetical protein
MTRTRTESRSRVGIQWFDNEAEANDVAAHLAETYGEESIADANIGFIQVGRDPALDRRDEHGAAIEFAVVTP